MIVATASWLKLTWTMAALLGVMITYILLFMSIADYRLLSKQNLNGWRKHVAKTSVYIFIGGFMTQFIYLVTGLIALTQPNTHGNTQRYVIQALFLFSSISGVVLSAMIYYRRRHIIAIIEKAIAGEEEVK